MSSAPVPYTSSAAPAPVHHSVRLWLVAIGAGVAEALVRLLLPEPPTLPELGIRFAIYTALAGLVLALYTGRDVVRWAVVVLLGGIGMLSLVAEPVSWLLAGGSPAAFLAGADASTLVVTVLRVPHIVAVVAALALLLRPESARFFRRR
jgi:hypothetical protein